MTSKSKNQEPAPPILHLRSPRDEEQTRPIHDVQDRMRQRDPEPGGDGEGGSSTVR
jgi:hypothetical protein